MSTRALSAAANNKRLAAVLDTLAGWKYVAISIATVAAFLLARKLAGSAGGVNPLLLPPLGEIVATAVDLAENGYRQSSLWHHMGVSTARASVAFAAAIAIGVPVGLAMGRSAVLAATLNPFPLPKIALIPLVVAWFGIGEGSKFFLIFISTLLSVLVGSAAAVQNVSQQRLGGGTAPDFLVCHLTQCLARNFHHH